LPRHYGGTGGTAPALLLSFAARFALEWSLALAAFWTTRVQALNQVYFALMMFLSGRIAPIEVFPEPLREAAALLPFYYMVAFPVEIFLGRLEPTEVLNGIAVQALWLSVSALLITAIWRLALRRFTAVGS